jgi:uncharacterized membrane protein YdjX (TVP38/TMEM64 family)
MSIRMTSPGAEKETRPAGERSVGRRRRARWIFGALAVAAVALALAWRFTPLAEWVDPEAIQARLVDFRASPWRVPVVWALFVLGGLLVVPINLLFLATGLAFPFLEAIALSMSGGLLSGLLLHALGRRLDLDGLLAHVPARLRRRVEEGIDRAGLPELVVLRLLPLGPYTTMNLLWGAAGVGRGPLLLASALGLAPAVVLTAMIGSGLRTGLEARALVLLALGSLGLGGLAILGARWARS